MAYTKNATWVDHPDTSTLVTAAKLNNIEDGIYTAHTQTINAQTGTTYTLVAADASKLVTCTNAGAITVTVPANVFTAGQRVDVAQRGAGVVTAVEGSGMTVNPPPGRSLVLTGQYAYVSLFFQSATEADLVGDVVSA